MPRSISDEEIDQMVAEDLAEADERRAELEALVVAINALDNVLLKRILLKILELMT